MSSSFLAKHVNKLIASGLLVIVCLVVLISYLWSQAKATDERLLEQQFTLSLVNLSQNIDARIASMQLIAKTVANDTHIQKWVASGFADNQESILVDKLRFLVSEYGLTSASFADKNTHKYWNQEGFLRVLQPETDTWYFAYLESGESDLVSVYHDKNKHRVDVYVNYQQPDGKGLSGVATSFDGVLEILKNSLFAKYGDIYLVDNLGKIQVHAEADVAGIKSLQDMFSKDIIDRLLQPNASGFIEFNQAADRLLGASYIPSMNWYVVANVTKKID
jgi:methyl-accepting chemotaxis protein